MNFNFSIQNKGPVSQEFLRRNIPDLAGAAEFVRRLPYRRNADKQNLLSVLSDNCGTCSTKHALLKSLAEENEMREIKLILGIFRMNARNTPPVAEILAKHELDYIPEAHNYLRTGNGILDCTKPNWSIENFISDLLEEIEIAPGQITEFKVSYHKNFLRAWLGKTKLKHTPEDLWSIREECISALGQR